MQRREIMYIYIIENFSLYSNYYVKIFKTRKVQIISIYLRESISLQRIIFFKKERRDIYIYIFLCRLIYIKKSLNLISYISYLKQNKSIFSSDISLVMLRTLLRSLQVTNKIYIYIYIESYTSWGACIVRECCSVAIST